MVKIKETLRFWEPRRITYNLVLAGVVLTWLALTWPHFQPALHLHSLLLLVVLAVMANLCYCIAYLGELLAQFSAFRRPWRAHREWLWLASTAFAVLLECYWIADEIYPFVQ